MTVNINVYDIMEDNNSEWAHLLRIPDLNSAADRPIHYLYILCISIFPNCELYQGKANEDKSLVELKCIRSIFEQYGIQPPAHWSPLINLHVGDQRPQAQASFNQIIHNLRYFLTPDAELRNELSQDIENRYQKCIDLESELESVAKEDKFYNEKFKQIEGFLQTQTGSEKDKVQAIINQLFYPTDDTFQK